MTISVLSQDYKIIEAFHLKTSTNSDITSKKIKIIPDFQVNKNIGPRCAHQTEPYIASCKKGTYIVVWEDNRNGNHSDIYAQLFSKIGKYTTTNFKVNDDIKDNGHASPCVTMGNVGNFIIVWEDYRDDEMGVEGHIYAQKYSSDGTKIGENFRVDDEKSKVGQSFGNPSLTITGMNTFVITWEDFRIGSILSIHAQRFDNNGIKLGGNFKVNDDESNYWKYSPQIASGQDGNFVITWCSEDGFIYVQCYDSNGVCIGSNVKVNEISITDSYSFPSIAMIKSGQYLIVWSNMGRITMQFYTKDGNPIGSNMIIDHQTGNIIQEHPTVMVNNEGNYVITWEDIYTNPDFGEYEYNIYAQRYSVDSTPISSAFMMNSSDPKIQPCNSIAIDEVGDFYIAMQEKRNSYDYDICLQHYSESGIMIDTDFKINDDKGSSEQRYPVISVDPDEEFIIAWLDFRESKGGYGNLYAQRFSSNGIFQNDYFKITDDDGSVRRTSSSIAVTKNKNWIITWDAFRDIGTNIYAQRYTANDIPVGVNYKINENIIRSNSFPTTTSSGDGTFWITWSGCQNDDSDIFLQRYLNSGISYLTNTKVNDDISRLEQRLPTIAADSSGNFVITWVDYRNAHSDIYAQRFISEQYGTAIGNNIKINDDNNSSWQTEPCIAINNQGLFVIAWSDDRNNDVDIYAQRCSMDGNFIGHNFKVNDDNSMAKQILPSLSMDDNGNFVIVWEDYRNSNPDIYGQRYLSDGTPLGQNFLVTESGTKEQRKPCVKLGHNKIYTTWEDNRAGGTGFDIWANILDWDNPEYRPPQFPENIVLFQNYPNPFNTSTIIPFQLANSGFVHLKVYDLMGREVTTLLNELFDAGEYKILFNGKNCASGIYFYQLRIRDVCKRKKLVLAK